MAAPYSTDLRKRILIEWDKDQLKKYEISELFQVDLKTIYNWVRQRNATGKIEAKSGYQKGRDGKITDVDRFKKFIAENPNLSLIELSQKWGDISPSTIGRNLIKLGYTFKKNSLATKNVMKKNGKNIAI